MNGAARLTMLAELGDDAVVLDVGGWAKPFARADWVADLLPYATRGLYGEPVDPATERFSEATWVQLDLCDRDPWPFADGQFDFAVCSHTLEDLRDPVGVCRELNRVAKAGYVEVPSRAEEQTLGVHGSWVGWSHHHWLCDVDPDAPSIEFLFKPHLLTEPGCHLPAGTVAPMRIASFFWEGSFAYGERFFLEPNDLMDDLRAVVSATTPPARADGAKRRLPRLRR